MIAILSVFNSCESWMKDDDFFATIEEEVRVANASQIDVYVRCGTTNMGTTTPNGWSVFKQDVASVVSVVPGLNYGFWKWAAFSTADFNPSTQNSSFVYVDEQKYSALREKELPLSVVSFGDPKSTSTSVTVHVPRSDIAIVPISVELPYALKTSPANNKTDVSRNMSIRMLFSRPMDSSSCQENIRIYQGTVNFAASDDNMVDITDRFNISASGSIVSCVLKGNTEEYMYKAGYQITVRYSSDLRDADGYNVASAGSFAFIAGGVSNVDTTAPKIVELKADRVLNDSASSNSFDMSYSQKNNAADNQASKSSVDDFTEISTHRVGEDVYINVVGMDFSGLSTDPREGDDSEVAIVKFRAKSLFDAEGNKISSSSVIEQENSYEMSKNHKLSLASLPDGLIRIDVALVDTVGNSGFDTTSTCLAAIDNGYKTIFVVKDTTSPSAADNKDKIKLNQTSSWFNATSITSLYFKDNGIADDGNVKLRSASDGMKWIVHLGAAGSWTTPAKESADWKPLSTNYTLDTRSGLIQGSVPVSAVFMDDVGNMSSQVDLDSLVKYDSIKPVVGNAVQWVAKEGNDGLIPGVTGEYEVKKQSLYIPFVESNSGVKKLTIGVKRNTGAGFGDERSDSMKSSDLQVYYLSNLLVKDTDYTVSGNSIEFKNSIMTGSLKVSGITIEDEGYGTDATYQLNVKLTDEAGNVSENLANPPQISRDSMKPEIDKIIIPEVEENKTVDGTVTYIAGADAGLAYNSSVNGINLKIRVLEKTSGLQEILIGSDGNVKFTSSSQLKIKYYDGTSKDLVRNTDYAIDSSYKKITFLNSTIPVAKDSAGKFEIEISGCAFENVVTKTNSDGINKFSFTLKDFAQLTSDEKTKVECTSDGTKNIAEVCVNSLPAKFVAVNGLEDRSPCTDGTTVDDGKNDTPYDLLKAKDGFTNYEVVNLHIESNESSFTDGCNSVETITLEGATFIDAGYNGASSNNTAFEFEIDGGTPKTVADLGLTLSFSDDKHSVSFGKSFTKKTVFKFYNILLENSGLDGSHTVTVTFVPKTSIVSAEASGSKAIVLDKTIPALDPDGPYPFHSVNADNYIGEFPRQANSSTTQKTVHGIKASSFRNTLTKAMENGTSGTDIVYFYTKFDESRYPITVTEVNPRKGSSCMQTRIVRSIAAGKATSKGVVRATADVTTEFESFRTGEILSDNYVKFSSVDKSNANQNPYTYVAADAAGNVSEPHQFYVIKDAAGPSKTYDGSAYTEGVANSKSIVNLMMLDCPEDKRVFRNDQKTNSKMTYSSSGDDFFFGNNTGDAAADWGNVWSYKYVLGDIDGSDSYKIVIRLSGTKTGDKLLNGDDASSGISYIESKPDASQSGLAKWCVSTFYTAFNSNQGTDSETEIGWCAIYPEGTAGAKEGQQGSSSAVKSRLPNSAWNDYVPGEDIVIEIPKNKSHIAPMTLCLMDNCGNLEQIMIRPNDLEAGTINSVHSSDERYSLMGGHAISFVYDKILPSLQTWSSRNVENLSNQFIMYAGACDSDDDDCTHDNITGGNTTCGLGNNRFGALYLNNKTQYYNHNVYLMLQINSGESVIWSTQETRTNNVQKLYEDNEKPADFTLRARILCREGTSFIEPSVSDFEGNSRKNLTKWSYYKQTSSDATRLWNILLPHLDEGVVGTMWLYLEDYVGNKKIVQVYNGISKESSSACVYFVWNDEPPRVKLSGGEFPGSANSIVNNDFSSYGSYRYYEHLCGDLNNDGVTDAKDLRILVPDTRILSKSDQVDQSYIGEDFNVGDVVNRIHTVGTTTFFGNTVWKLSDTDTCISLDDQTCARSKYRSKFDVRVEKSPSGIKGFKYNVNAGSYNRNERSTNEQGQSSAGYWYTGSANNGKVNVSIPFDSESNKTPGSLYLYIYDNVGNISITKMGNTNWCLDTTYPAAVPSNSGETKTWKNGQGYKGISYVKQAQGESDVSSVLNEAVSDLIVTIAGSSPSFKNIGTNPYPVKIPASWYVDYMKRTDHVSGTGSSSGIYGAGLNADIIGNAIPVSDNGTPLDPDDDYLTVNIPYSIYSNATESSEKKLSYYIFDNTGNYWPCCLHVLVDENAPVMRVGVTRLDSNSTFHSADNLYSKVYGDGAVPTGMTADTVSGEDARLETQGNALKSYSSLSGYSRNKYEHLYSLASNVSMPYDGKAEVDYAYEHGTADEKSRFFKIRSNNAAFFVNAWAEDNSGVSQVSIRKWDGTKWTSDTAMGPKALEFNNTDSNVKSMKFETNPPSPYTASGKAVSGGDLSKRYAIYVSTETQVSESLYEVSASDFAGNTVFYYAYILPFDNTVPEVTGPSVKGNAGSSVVDGKFYYNDLKYSVEKIEDKGVGLGAYAYSYKNGGSEFKSSYRIAEGASLEDISTESGKLGDCFKLYVQDILGNSKEINKFSVDGESSEFDSSKFVFDNVSPVVSGYTVTRSGKYMDFHSEENETDNPSSMLISKGENQIIIKSDDFLSTIKISPAATDAYGINGYILTESDAAPEFNAASVIAAPVTFECAKNKTNSISARTVKLESSGPGFTFYIWAVDYAGNISENPYRMNIKHQSYKPSIVEVSDGNIPVKIDASKDTVIYKDGTVNYYSSSAYIEIKTEFFDGYEPDGWKIFDETGRQIAYGKFSDDVNTTFTAETATRGTLKLYLPDLSDASKTAYGSGTNNTGKQFNFCVTKSYYGDSQKYALSHNGISKWIADTTAPTAPATPAITNENGIFVDDSGAVKTLYYKDSTSSCDIEFTVTDSGSGYAGVLYSTGASVPVVDEGNMPKKKMTLSNLTEDSMAFYAYDNVLNRSSAYTLSVKKDVVAPVVSSVTPVVNDYAYYDEVNGCVWFNGSGSAAKVPSVKIKAVASDALSGIGSYGWTSDVSGVTLTGTSEVTVGGFDLITDTCTITLKVKDNVGNESTASAIVLKKDADSPSGLAVAGLEGVTAEDEGKYVYSENSDWKIVSGGTVYYNSNKISLTSGVFDFDSGLSDAGSGLKTPGTETTLSGNVYTVTAKDKVGNETTYAVTLIADSAAPLPADATGKINWNAGGSQSGVKCIGSSLAGSEIRDGLVSSWGSTAGNTILYTAGTTLSLSVTDDCGVAAYGFKLSNLYPPTSLTADQWVDVASASAVTLPELEGPNHSFLYVWIKDKVGNVSSAYPLTTGGDSAPWVNCYKKPLDENGKCNVSVLFQRSSNERTITLSGIKPGFGIKEISFSGSNIESSGIYSATIEGDLSSGSSSATANYVLNSLEDSDGSSDSVVLSLAGGLAVTGNGNLTIKYYGDGNESTLSVLKFKDNEGNEYTAEIPTGITRSIRILKKTVASVSAKVTSAVASRVATVNSVFGSAYSGSSNNAVESFASSRNERKTLRAAEISAAKEARKRAKQELGAGRNAAERIRKELESSVEIPDAAEVSRKSVTSVPAVRSIIAEPDVESGDAVMDQWESAKNSQAAIDENRSHDRAVIAVVLILAMCGTGSFIFLRKKRK